jgi:hypothetical protein
MRRRVCGCGGLVPRGDAHPPPLRGPPTGREHFTLFMFILINPRKYKNSEAKKHVVLKGTLSRDF